MNGQPCPDCRGHFEMKADISTVKEYAKEHCEDLRKENDKQWDYLKPDGVIFTAIDKQGKAVNRILVTLLIILAGMVGNIYVTYETSQDAVSIGKTVAQEIAKEVVQEIRRDNPDAIH